MSETDVVDVVQPERSSLVQAFLTTVRPGAQYAFFDLDGTITSPTFDVEDHAVVNYLIEPTRFDEWTTKVLRKYPGDFRYIYKDRHVTRAYMVKTATARLFHEVGRTTGNYLLSANLLQEGAWETIVACVDRGVQVVVLTASPGDVARGVIEELVSQKKLASTIVVLGSEYAYDKGLVTEDLWMRGPNKSYVVEAVKAKGARAVLGAGDSPSYSDAFVALCEIPVVVDQDDQSDVTKTWEQARGLLELAMVATTLQ